MKGEPVPEPIAPEGIAQVFADAECREYANGTLDRVYVRINGGPFEFGDAIDFGTFPDSLSIYTPTTADPDNAYAVVAYVDFMSDDMTDPIQPGQIVECVASDAYDVTNYTKIWYGG